MSLLGKIKALFRARRAWAAARELYTEVSRAVRSGERLSDGATKTTKILQLWGSVITGLVALVGAMFGVSLDIPSEWIAGAGLALLGVLNGLATVVSTRKIGLGGQNAPPALPSDDSTDIRKPVDGLPWLDEYRQDRRQPDPDEHASSVGMAAWPIALVP